MLTKQPFAGTIEIVGALNPSTLVFKGFDGDLHTIGKDFEADYVAENILCEKGIVAHSFVRSIDLSNQLLSQITTYIDTSVENYLFGDLSTTDKVSLPENIKIFSPVTGGGGTIKLNYARYHDICTFNLEFVFVTKGILTVKTIFPGSSQVASSSPGLTLPRLENFAQISFTLDPKESLELFKSKGDTVKEKELIARKNLAQFFEDQVDLNTGKIEALQNQKSLFLSDINQKIASAEQAARIDSSDYYHRAELSKDGFSSDRSLKLSEMKWQKSRTALSQLIASRSEALSKITLETRKLKLTNRQLKTRAHAADAQSEIRSSLNGVLLDIRQVPHNNKTQVTLIIKRIH